MKPVGLLGGTFDPIHLGHLRLAEELAEALDIHQVRVIPAGLPPHRGVPRVPPQHRLAMAALAIAGNPRLTLDDYEARKPTPCYMVETLAHLRGEMGLDTPLALFLGADAFQGLTGWHQWPRLFDLAHLAIAQRPGVDTRAWHDTLPEALREQLATRLTTQPADLTVSPAGRIWLQAITQLDISASRIRQLHATGHSIRYLVPDTVLHYIEQHQLYRQEDT